MITAERSARDRAVWALFEDWCAACGAEAFPADSETLARFLAANPAADSTQRRRVSIINGAHRDVGLPPPGRAEQIRSLLNAHRAERLQQRTQRVTETVRALPTAGWPTLLFARRDAMMLVLSTTGMTFETLALLRIGDVVATPEGHLDVRTGGSSYRTPVALPDSGVFPAQILVDWQQVRAVQHQSPSTRVLAEFIRADVRPSAMKQPPAGLPLLTALDRWGSAPLHGSPVTARAVRSIVAAHLGGNSPAHRVIQPRAAHKPEQQKAAEPATPALLDPRSFDRGITARQQAGQALADVPAILDEVEDRAERILTDLLRLLEN
ncbi:recombinase [Mycobacteroides abscessus]|uniref:recombinase n=1 Tax=Mycobacteroides abscessus TaxID=36809 RepID=UPI000C26AC2B|nr:recombinase [Mycobacteroides abscessus]